MEKECDLKDRQDTNFQ